jgi:hypothetical protein
MKIEERGGALRAEVAPPGAHSGLAAHPTPRRSARLVESPCDLAAFTLFILCVVIPTIAWAWLLILVATS